MYKKLMELTHRKCHYKATAPTEKSRGELLYLQVQSADTLKKGVSQHWHMYVSITVEDS